MIIYAMSHEPTWYIHGRAVASRGWQAGNADPAAAVLAAGSEATLAAHASGGQHVYLFIFPRLRKPCRQARGSDRRVPLRSHAAFLEICAIFAQRKYWATGHRSCSAQCNRLTTGTTLPSVPCRAIDDSEGQNSVWFVKLVGTMHVAQHAYMLPSGQWS